MREMQLTRAREGVWVVLAGLLQPGCDMRRLMALGALGAFASLLAMACDAEPIDGGGSSGYPYPGSGYGGSGYGGSGGGSSSGSGYGYDAGYPSWPDAAAPEAEAAAPAIPPIAAVAPGNAPALCSGGAVPSAYLWARDGTLFAFDPGSLATRSLGVVSCPTAADPWALSVASADTAYVLYEDGNLFEIDLATLACRATSYRRGQLGFSGEEGLTVGAGRTAERLYVYGNATTPTLGLSDLSSFRLFQLGAVGPGAAPFPVDLKSDAYGRLFALTSTGTLAQLDPSTGAILGQDPTGFDTSHGSWALMAYDGRLYLFGGDAGGVSRYEIATKTLQPLGQVNQTVVGASATPCLSAGAAPAPVDAGSVTPDPDAAPPADPDAGAPDPEGGSGGGDAGAPASPFSPGDAWLGTYACTQGITDVAVLIESIDGDTIHARFDFDWVDGATQGSYEMTGRFDAATREVTFEPGRWVSQPGSSWSPVGMDGYVDLSGTSYAGNITYAGCGAFSVSR